jgi:hypothetical protein
MDGVQLSKLSVGSVRDVSTSIGTWLIAEGCAQLEMRRESPPDGELKHSSIEPERHHAHERRGRGR